jgi:ribbon-helix-helix protein
LSTEVRTARLTILIDPRKKALFEQLCAAEDANPSQIVRRLIRRYIEEKIGRPWTPGEAPRSPPRSPPRRARRAPSS